MLKSLWGKWGYNTYLAGILSVEDSSCGKQLIRSCFFLSMNVRNGYCSRSYNINKEIKLNSCLELLSNLSSVATNRQSFSRRDCENFRNDTAMRSVHREVSKCLRAALFANARKIDFNEFQVKN